MECKARVVMVRTYLIYHCRPPFPLKETNVIFIGLTTGDYWVWYLVNRGYNPSWPNAQCFRVLHNLYLFVRAFHPTYVNDCARKKLKRPHIMMLFGAGHRSIIFIAVSQISCTKYVLRFITHPALRANGLIPNLLSTRSTLTVGDVGTGHHWILTLP